MMVDLKPDPTWNASSAVPWFYVWNLLVIYELMTVMLIVVIF